MHVKLQERSISIICSGNVIKSIPKNNDKSSLEHIITCSPLLIVVHYEHVHSNNCMIMVHVRVYTINGCGNKNVRYS